MRIFGSSGFGGDILTSKIHHDSGACQLPARRRMVCPSLQSLRTRQRLLRCAFGLIWPIGALGLLATQACKKANETKAPITITIIDQNWPDAAYQRQRNEEFLRFTNETGIE